MPRLNNAETIALVMAKYGKDSLAIHEIPRTGFWLVAIKATDTQYKLYVCDPFKTSKRLVTKDPVSVETYTEIWVDLIKMRFNHKNNLTQMAREARMTVVPILQKHKQQPTTTYDLIHRPRSNSKGTKGDIHFTVKSTQNNGGLNGNVSVGY